VPAPDLVGRKLILDVHTRSVPLAADTDLERLASITPGMVGADLANLCNEAALQAARRHHDSVHHEDFTDALEKIILGAPRRMVLSDDDRRRTAYHEAGHAIVGMFTAGADPVRKVSIIPRGRALGVTFSSPDEDRVSYDRQALEAKLDVMFGGRVAEELTFDEVTTGAENDIEQATNVARAMTGRWGMSDKVGFMAVLPQDGSIGRNQWSESTRRIVDEETRRILDTSHDRVTRLLTDYRDRLEALAEALLRHETLDQDAAYAAAGTTPGAATLLSAGRGSVDIPTG
jgi:cell division protease FtsH